MEKISTIQLPEAANLTIVPKEKKEVKPARLVNLRQIKYTSQILLPPPQEMYIKPKKHDFL